MTIMQRPLNSTTKQIQPVTKDQLREGASKKIATPKNVGNHRDVTASASARDSSPDVSFARWSRRDGMTARAQPSRKPLLHDRVGQSNRRDESVAAARPRDGCRHFFGVAIFFDAPSRSWSFGDRLDLFRC